MMKQYVLIFTLIILGLVSCQDIGQEEIQETAEKELLQKRSPAHTLAVPPLNTKLDEKNGIHRYSNYYTNVEFTLEPRVSRL